MPESIPRRRASGKPCGIRWSDTSGNGEDPVHHRRHVPFDADARHLVGAPHNHRCPLVIEVTPGRCDVDVTEARNGRRGLRGLVLWLTVRVRSAAPGETQPGNATIRSLIRLGSKSRRPDCFANSSQIRVKSVSGVEIALARSTMK